MQEGTFMAVPRREATPILRGRRAHAIPLVIVATFACDGGTTAVREYASRAIVYGYVTDPNGAPVVDINVRSWAHPDSCRTTDAFAWASPQPTYVQTNAEGRYRQGLVSGSFPFTACVSLELVAAGTRDQVVATVRGDTVRFTESNPGAQYDSVRVDVRLP